MRSILDLDIGYICVVDDDEIIDGNQKFLIELGYTTTDEIQRDFLEATEIKDGQKHKSEELLHDKEWLKFLLPSSERFFRVKLKRDENIFNFEISAKSMLYMSGVSDTVYKEKNFVVLCLHEVSRVLNEMEKSREKDFLLMRQSKLAAMGEMIANITHQWRQPINVLSSMSQNILHKSQNGTLTDEYINETMKKELGLITYLSETIDTFRHYFSPQKEKIRFCLRVALESAIEFTKITFSKSRVSFGISGESELFIVGYQNEFMQAILNILNNAKDVLLERDAPTKSVYVSLKKTETHALVTIEDSGGGIDESIISNIFDPYFTTKGSKGTGIGLYMTKMIIEQSLQGKICVTNGEHGAQFIIEIPFGGENG